MRDQAAEIDHDHGGVTQALIQASQVAQSPERVFRGRRMQPAEQLDGLVSQPFGVPCRLL